MNNNYEIGDKLSNRIETNQELENCLNDLMNYLDNLDWVKNLEARVEFLPEDCEEVVIDLTITSRSLERCLRREDFLYDIVEGFETEKVNIYPIADFEYRAKQNSWLSDIS